MPKCHINTWWLPLGQEGSATQGLSLWAPASLCPGPNHRPNLTVPHVGHETLSQLFSLSPWLGLSVSLPLNRANRVVVKTKCINVMCHTGHIWVLVLLLFSSSQSLSN